MQSITICGNIGKTAEIRTTQSGQKVAGFSVAVNNSRDKDAPPTWWECSLWGNRGDKLAQYLTQGTKVTVIGEFSTRDYEGKTYLQCSVDQIALQGGGSQGQSQGGQSQGGQSQGQSGGYGDQGGSYEDSDSIPF